MWVSSAAAPTGSQTVQFSGLYCGCLEGVVLFSNMVYVGELNQQRYKLKFKMPVEFITGYVNTGTIERRPCFPKVKTKDPLSMQAH